MNIFLLLKLSLSLLLLSALVDAQTLNLEDARILKLESVELLTPTEEKTSIKIQMKEYNVDNKSLLFKIKNISNSSLENVKFVIYIYINGEKLKNESDADQKDEIMRFLIPSGKVLEDIRFDLPDELKITEKTLIKLKAFQDDKLLAVWNNV